MNVASITTKNSLGRRPRSNNTTLEIANQLKQKTKQQQQYNQLHTANALYTLPYKQNQLKYMHQTFCNALLQTLIKAANNEQLEGIPFLKADLIQKYLPPSPATSKGRMKRPRTGIRSTHKKGKADEAGRKQTWTSHHLTSI